MDQPSTVATFIQRFREAAPLSPDQRRRDRQAMEGQFWWAQQSSSHSEDDDFETDTSPPPPLPPPTQGDGSNRDPEDSGSMHRGRAPPPPPPPYGYREQTYFNFSEHKTLDANCKHAAPQDARNTDQTTLASSLFSPTCPPGPPGPGPSSSPGPPGPPSRDGDRPRSDDGDGLHQQTLAGEREVPELAASLLAASLPEHQAAASSLGASSRSLLERSVGATRMSTMDTSIEGEGCDELANLDARASSLLEHCRQLLSAPPTDDAEQEATRPTPDPFSSGERSSAVAPLEDGTSCHTHQGRKHQSHTRQGLEQRAWMLLGNREPLEDWEANLHDSLLPTSVDSDLSPVRTNRHDQAAREAVPIEGLALAKRTEVDATHGNTLRKNTISGLDSGERRAWSTEQGNNGAAGDEDSDSRSLLPKKEIPANCASPCMRGVNHEAFNHGRSSGPIHKQDGREMALSELTSATEDFNTGMDSVLRQFTEGDIPLGFDLDGSVNVHYVADFGRHCRMTNTSPAEPPWASRLVGNRPQEHVSAMTPSARAGRQDDSVASLKVFAEDPVIIALLERAHEIEAELERRYLGRQ